MADAGNGRAGGDVKSTFRQIYFRLKAELLEDPAFDFTDEGRQWINRMLDYNVPGGKLNRGISVIDSYKLLKGTELSDDQVFLACALGWCIEWLQAYFLVLDDIMDNSHTRRGQLCWFRVDKVGLIAANDGIILRNHIPRILKRYFREKPYYADLLDLFNEVEFQTASGQMLDLITTYEGKQDLSKYTMPVYHRIVQYKTAYYSFYLPDDYLDCFGDPEAIGKIGTDIEDFKCSWLVVQAMAHANESQKKILTENYGKSDSACVAKVKSIYKDLDIQNIFFEYERMSYEQLISSIEGLPGRAVQEVLKSFLHKIYKRRK
uniref:Farnesyl pyrophosphate synthase isoform X2 n=1 Tax=Elaeis guineensis var. tenera TaxID=51953 RepID=A0A6I9RDA4_ELAGV|nr:farnesyl pyrophosphate synthase isoform X2 [Elaeis guineensis]